MYCLRVREASRVIGSELMTVPFRRRRTAETDSELLPSTCGLFTQETRKLLPFEATETKYQPFRSERA